MGNRTLVQATARLVDLLPPSLETRDILYWDPRIQDYPIELSKENGQDLLPHDDWLYPPISGPHQGSQSGHHDPFQIRARMVRKNLCLIRFTRVSRHVFLSNFI